MERKQAQRSDRNVEAADRILALITGNVIELIIFDASAGGYHNLDAAEIDELKTEIADLLADLEGEEK